MTNRVSWGARQRLEFIEYRLFWEGELNRSEIMERFTVSVPQASADLAAYRELAPSNIAYNASRRRYVATAHFEPRLLKPNAERYLAQLRAISENVIDLSDTFIASIPEAAVMPIPSRRVEPLVLRSFLRAIRGRQSISVQYQSMNDKRPDLMWREITPHALGSDGFRWHIRAYCHLERVFKDFIISRCLKLGELGQPKGLAADDINWNSFCEVDLIPNPRLSAAQQRTIELDYGMTRGKTSVRVRYALLYYFDKRMRLDVAEQHDRPKETPVIVKNREQYDRILNAVSY